MATSAVSAPRAHLVPIFDRIFILRYIGYRFCPSVISNNAENHSGPITFAPNSDHPTDFSLPAQPLGFVCHERSPCDENKNSIFRIELATDLWLPVSAKDVVFTGSVVNTLVSTHRHSFNVSQWIWIIPKAEWTPIRPKRRLIWLADLIATNTKVNAT